VVVVVVEVEVVEVEVMFPLWVSSVDAFMKFVALVPLTKHCARQVAKAPGRAVVVESGAKEQSSTQVYTDAFVGLALVALVVLFSPTSKYVVARVEASNMVEV
jgi:hypothetical protein